MNKIPAIKNILLLTDFSANANHIAAYAYDFAKKIQADITLCNAVTIPSELPNAGLVSWPFESPEAIQNQSKLNLHKLRVHLQGRDQSHMKKPQLAILNQSGRLQKVVSEIISDRPIDLLAMGTHDDNSMDSFLKIDQARKMIDSLLAPVLIISLKSKFRFIRSIYFASDLIDLPGDSAFLSQLVNLSRSFMAEIFVVNVSSRKADGTIKEKIYDMINDLRRELGYPGIHFWEINGDNEVSTFEKMMIEKRMDLLVVVHRKRGFFSRLLKGSVTKKLVGKLGVPMLIYNQNK